MISCVIIDDEKPARESLSLMLTRYFPGKVEVAAMAGSVGEGVLAICRNNPDLVFLDIEMPGENGFKLFDYFQQVPFSVIFITAYSEYAIKAIKVAALDYILKPVSVNSLKEAMELYEKRLFQGIPSENLGKLAHALNSGSSGNEKVALPTFEGFQFEKAKSIVFCRAEQNYTRVFISDGRELLVSKPLNLVQKLLPANRFYRIHKSHLVNMVYIKTYSRSEGFHVILENGTRLDVASRRNEDFLKALTHRDK